MVMDGIYQGTGKYSLSTTLINEIIFDFLMKLVLILRNGMSNTIIGGVMYEIYQGVFLSRFNSLFCSGWIFRD